MDSIEDWLYHNHLNSYSEDRPVVVMQIVMQMVPISANHTNYHNFFYFSQYPFTRRIFFHRLEEK